MPIKRFRHLPLLAVINLFTGCATLGDIPAYEKKPQGFTAYAEDVFRRQNNATSLVMTLSPDEVDDAGGYEALLSAEKNMQGVCELLNDYARRTQDKKGSTLLLRSRVGFSVKNCDRATHKLETLLEEFDLAGMDIKRGAE
jgi:hypothetical protein